MLRVSLFLLFLLFFNLSGCFSQESWSPMAVKDDTEEIDPYSWDFGQVKEGEVLAHDFILKNESKQVLNIKDTSTSCGCTVLAMKKKTLLPGEETAIEVKFNTKGYLGFVQQFVYVNTDSIDNPVIRFVIKANVIK